MKRILILLAAVAAPALTASALATASPNPTVKSGRTAVGKILVNRHGFTVYEFSRDARNLDRCAAIHGCPGIWPAVSTKGKPTAGPGLKTSLLGTIVLHSGIRQVTYAGHPLYTYTGDTGPAQTGYVGFRQFGGNWDALNPAGHRVR